MCAPKSVVARRALQQYFLCPATVYVARALQPLREVLDDPDPYPSVLLMVLKLRLESFLRTVPFLEILMLKIRNHNHDDLFVFQFFFGVKNAKFASGDELSRDDVPGC